MTYEIKKEETVNGLGEVGYIAAPFNVSMKAFKAEGYKLIQYL